jgi:PAS domain S-box-containing protein
MEEQRSAQLAAIVAASSDAIVSIGTDLAVQTWNPGAQRLFGYSESEAVGRSIVELTTPAAYEAEYSAIYADAMSSRTAVLKETVRRHKDGRLLPVETNVSPILDGLGNVTSLSIVVRDISKRRRAEDELRHHVERQTLLLELTSGLLRATEPSQLSRLTFQHIGPAIGADICANFRLDSATQHLTLEFGSGIPPELSEALQSLELGQTYCGMAAANRQPVVADKERIACDPNGAFVHALGATAYACHPLLATDGRLLGTFAVGSRTRQSFTDDEIAWLNTVINFLAQAWERLEREEKEHLLMREINHRAKNMLSVVDAIAHQTAAKNPEDFIERFSERIQALSANQDLLVRNEWKGVEIDDLVHAQLAHFADLIGSRIAVQGPRWRLNPASAQAIGLAVHELATNAGKYGALSTDRGRVDIRWDTDGDTFTITWTERDGLISRPNRRGFGTIVIESMAERSVGGEVALDYAPSGLTWRLTCPAANALERRSDSPTQPAGQATPGLPSLERA